MGPAALALGQVASQTRRERAGSPRRTWVYVEGCQGARNEVWRSKLPQCPACWKGPRVLAFSPYGLQRHAEPAEDVLPDEGQSPQARAPDARALGGHGHLRQDSPGRGQAPLVDPPRRAALCQWPYPHGASPEQGAQGLHRQIALHAGPQCRLRARLGLPRSAHRARGGQGARARHGVARRAARHGSAREDRPLPRVRRALRRDPAGRIQAPRRLRRLEASLRHDGAGLPGDDRAGVRALRRSGHRVQGSEARALVHALQDGAGPGRGRVRGPADAQHLREVRGQDAVGRPRGRARRSARSPRDLDDDAVDAARQPRHRRASGRDVHRGGGGRRGAGRRARARAGVPRAAGSERAGRADRARGVGGRSRRHRLSPSLHRSRRARGGGRLGRDGRGHGARPHRPGARRRGLRAGQAGRPADLQSRRR